MMLVLLGPPGSGKGTQAEMLRDALGVPHVSTGDLLRAEADAGTPLGAEVAPLLAAGELVPDRLIEGVLEQRLRAPDAAPGAILDGYPRTVEQATTLDARLAANGRSLAAVLWLDVDEGTLTERLRGRAREEHRADDNPSALAERLTEFRQRTEPVVDHYRGRAVPVLEVDGRGAVDDVHGRLVRALEDAGVRAR